MLFLYMFKFNKPKTQQTIPQPQQVPQQAVQNVTVDISKITGRIDKMQNDLSKVISDSNNEIKESIQGLGKNLEELALAIKASKSDEESPFNIESVIRKEDNNSNTSSVIGESLPNNIDLKKIIQLSVLLFMMDYDKEKIISLFRLDLLSSKDVETIEKIEEILAKNRAKISASDLALVAYDIAKVSNTVDNDVVKYISLILGDLNGGRSNQ
ncbi:hypothetical protein HS5_02090 [Acidianus sp. HS-5]|nr:hypothetical protein HS5_02090 [Acidianus sp. HS-5]